MKRFISLGLISLSIAALPFAAYAQTTSTNLSASAVLGPQNTQNLSNALGALVSTLGQLNVQLGNGQITNTADISASLSGISNSLATIGSTVAVLYNRATGLAQNGTSGAPGLPNTGAGG